MKQRNRNLDIAKGICITCMILVHMFSWWNNSYPDFNKYTGVFFLVFFFFSSGLCFQEIPWKKYVIKRLRRLILPYCIWNLIYAVYLWLYSGTFNGMSLSYRLYVIVVNAIESFPVGMAHVDFFHTDTYGVGPIWFVHCIFYANIFYRFICRWKYRLPISVAIAFVATISQRFWVFPFNLQDALIGCMFIAIGDCARGLYLNILKWLNSQKFIISILAFLPICIVYVLMIQKLPYQWMNLGGNLYYMRSLLASCIGFLLVIGLAFLIEKTALFDEIFELFGRNSMFILIIHTADILMIRNWNLMNWQFIAVTFMGYALIIYLKNRLITLFGKSHSISGEVAEMSKMK